MRLSELREKTAPNRYEHPSAMLFNLKVGDLQRLMVDIENELAKAYNRGFHDGMLREQQLERMQQSPLHAVGTQPMRSEDLGDHNPGGWRQAEGIERFPKVAYSVEESDARLKLLTDKLFSAVQRIELLEKRGAEKALHERIDNLTAGLNESRDAQSRRFSKHTERLERLEAARKGETANYQEQNARITDLENRNVSVMAHERLLMLEEWRKMCSTAVIPWPAEVLGRIEKLEQEQRVLGNSWHEHQRTIEELKGHPERLGSSEKHADRRIEELEGEAKKMAKALATDYDATKELRELIGFTNLRVGRIEQSMETCARMSDVNDLARRLDSYRGSAVIDGVDQLKALRARMDLVDARSSKAEHKLQEFWAMCESEAVAEGQTGLIPSYLRNRLAQLETRQTEAAQSRLSLGKKIEQLERGEIGPAQLVVNITDELAKHEGTLNDHTGALNDHTARFLTLFTRHGISTT